jgi:hypothetical protein
MPLPTISAVVIDYDRSLVDEEKRIIKNTVTEELKRVSEMGIVTVLATGRILKEIPDKRVFKLFDFIVAENGSIIYDCNVEVTTDLAPPGWKGVKCTIEDNLRRLGIEYISGENIISLSETSSLQDLLESCIQEKEYGLERNASDLMILPFGINKGFAIRRIVGSCNGLVLGIGDNSNDLSLFESVNVRFAVSNAEQILKERADFITTCEDGMGVVEVLSSIKPGKVFEWDPKQHGKL